MKIRIAAIVAFGVLIAACEKADEQMTFGAELHEGLLEIQQDRELSDQEMVAILQEWYSAEQMAMREDLWGPGGLEAYTVKIIEDQREQMRRFETMSMLSEVFILEYLQQDDVEGAKEQLRSNLASRYREELREGTSPDNSMMTRVEKLAEKDLELRRLMNDKPSGEQGAAPNP